MIVKRELLENAVGVLFVEQTNRGLRNVATEFIWKYLKQWSERFRNEISSWLTHFLMQEGIIRLPHGFQRHARIDKQSTSHRLENVAIHFWNLYIIGNVCAYRGIIFQRNVLSEREAIKWKFRIKIMQQLTSSGIWWPLCFWHRGKICSEYMRRFNSIFKKCWKLWRTARTPNVAFFTVADRRSIKSEGLYLRSSSK